MKKITETLKQEIFAQCQDAQSQAQGDYAVNQERNNTAYLYYTAQLPKNIDATLTDKDAQETVIPVLYNTIKDVHSFVMDAFTEDEQIAAYFRSRGARKDPQAENLITQNINKVFLYDQDGYNILSQSVKQALIVGDCFIKAFVDEKTHTETDRLDDWIDITDYMSQLAEGWRVDVPDNFTDKKGKEKGFEWKTIKGIALDPQTGQPVPVETVLIKGKVNLYKIDKKLVIEQVEPRDLFFDTSYGSDFSKCRYMCHRVRTTVGEAELRGFDKVKLETAARNDKDNLLPTLWFSQQFYGVPGDLQERTSTDPKERAISLYEHYIYSSLLSDKEETKLYQVITTESEVLTIEEIAFFPFVHGQCETLNGSFYGRGFYDIAKPFQDALTTAHRLSMQVAKNSAYPSYLVQKGNYSRESLLNAHRPGSVVEQGAAGAVQRFQPLELSESFYTSLQMLQNESDKTLHAGFGSADLTEIPPIAAATVAMSIAQDAQKGKPLSQNIKRTLIQPLFKLMYNIMKYEGFSLFDENGQEVSGVMLPDNFEFFIDVNASGDTAAQVMQLTQAASFVGQMSQVNSPVCTPANLYKIVDLMCQRMDLNTADYFTDPTQNQDPVEQQQEQVTKAIQSEMMKMQLESAKINMRKEAAEVAKIEAQTEELIRDGSATRATKFNESLQVMQKAKNDADEIAVKAQAVGVKAREVEVKNKAVNYEAMLGAAKHATDITAPTINGVR